MSMAIAFPPDLVEALQRAQRVVVLTGAGVSAESGVPTFRDAQTGLWAQYDPAQLATPEAFRADPELVWRWYQWRRELVARAEPNAGHRALVELAARVSHFTLVTQNVDSLHQRAGSREVLELHGNIMRTVCFGCGTPSGGLVDLTRGVPRCGFCGDLLRPDVVWFGEALPADTLTRAALESRQANLFISAGTSSLVYPAASLPFEALTGGAALLEVNPDPTPLSSRARWSLRGPSGEILPALLACAFERAEC